MSLSKDWTNFGKESCDCGQNALQPLLSQVVFDAVDGCEDGVSDVQASVTSLLRVMT